jgi:D-alanyl-D-alanine carboxypeptidase (penicillin-binding protein 5/6)
MKRRMKSQMKRWMAALVLSLLAVSSAQAGQALTPKKAAKKPAPNPQIQALTAPATQPRPPYEAYAVVDYASGQILEGQNMQLRWPQASLTKIMLALLVEEKIANGELHPTDTVVVSKRAEGMGGTQVFLKAGEIFTLDELIKAALVESANDAAYAVAEHVAGTADGFVTLMNRKARALGMTDTEFHCVHGLPPSNGGPDNLTTCNDMILLARAALRHSRILNWTSIGQTTFRNGTLVLTNKNRLVGRLPGVDGLKTGYTRRAGFNIVATGKNGDKRLIVVVLGSPESRVRDAFAMEKFKEHLRLQPAEHREAVEATASGG